MSKRIRKSHDDPSEHCTPTGETEIEGNVDYGEQNDPLLSEQLLSVADVESDAGILESMTLKNFMCHSHLGPFTFGPNVNFVFGNNGSGKSAILTALIVTLGGNAQATNRGSSLKDFVKEGESSAEVSVTLRNSGRDSYKPEVYGSSITVDMRLTREGMRTYELKSKTGQIVSTKKEELLYMLEGFNIQVDNPMSVLTQEMSKSFLLSRREGDKYKFFMKATQLEQMKKDFDYIQTTKEIAKNKLKLHSECLEELKRKYLEKEGRYKNLACLDGMKVRLDELQKQMAWALVIEKEKELESLKEKLQAANHSTEKYDEKVEEWKTKAEAVDKKYNEIQEQLEKITQDVQELQRKCGELKDEAQKCKTLLKSSEVTAHRCRANLRDLEKDKVQLLSRINDLKLSISQTTGAESQARAERIQQIQTELENLRHHISTLGQQIDLYQHVCSQAKEEQERMRSELEGLMRSINANKENLQTVESSRSNRLRRFGEHMPALLNAIQEAHRRGQFKHVPRGPLGFLIKLKDPELALAVEICLEEQLQAFTCDNYDDEKVLLGLMGRVFPSGRRPAIITSPFILKVHDTGKRAVNHPDYPSVLQALEIEDPVVANCLIDQRGIESILLIKNRTEARRVMQSGNPPQNCTQAISIDGDEIYTNRSYSSDLTRAKYLSGDEEEEIRHLQRELENLNAQASRFNQQLRKLDDDVKQNDVLLRRAHVDQKTAKDKTEKLQLELHDLQNVEEPRSEDLKPLEEDLQDIVAEITSKHAEYEEAQTADLKASYEEAEQEYQRHEEHINTITEDADSIKEELSKTEQEVITCKRLKKHYDEKLGTHLREIQILESNLHSKEEEVKASTAKATEICAERLESGRTARSLDIEIIRLEMRISDEQVQQGDSEEVVREYHEASENYSAMEQQINNLTSFIQCIDNIMEKRLKHYAELRKLLSSRCKYYFHTMLAQRGYTGRMIFDHKNETLSISVRPGLGNQADLSDMRSLSGGERSFATVCFVLSLWAVTEVPFRCLDQFDVYMDLVNRRISMDMMLKVAAGQLYRQFIFLTPQSMGSLPVSENITILRLEDPERVQTALMPATHENP